jgi:hypothetical protein
VRHTFSVRLVTWRLFTNHYRPSAMLSAFNTVRLETVLTDSHVFARHVAEISALWTNHFTVLSASKHTRMWYDPYNVATSGFDSGTWNIYTTELRSCAKPWPATSPTSFFFFFFNGYTALLLGPDLLFSFVILFTDGRTPWTSDQPDARPLPAHMTTQTQNKRAHTHTHKHPCLE